MHITFQLKSSFLLVKPFKLLKNSWMSCIYSIFFLWVIHKNKIRIFLKKTSLIWGTIKHALSFRLVKTHQIYVFTKCMSPTYLKSFSAKNTLKNKYSKYSRNVSTHSNSHLFQNLNILEYIKTKHVSCSPFPTGKIQLNFIPNNKKHMPH